MDDINILTKHDNLATALDTAKQELQQLGLQLNVTKTECWINANVMAPADSHQGIPRTSRPTVLKATAEPMPIIPDDLANPTQILQESAPELQRLVTRRTAVEHAYSNYTRKVYARTSRKPYGALQLPAMPHSPPGRQALTTAQLQNSTKLPLTYSSNGSIPL
jgi:hypothetical protein